MRKKRETRETKQTVGMVCADYWYRNLDIPGYIKLSNVPDIQTAVNRIADLISSMTIHLMASTAKGDTRLKNGLSRMVDITPNKYTNHKEFYYGIVRNMLLDGQGNSIVVPKISGGRLDDMIPLDMSVTEIDDTLGYGYRITSGGVEYRPDDVLHFRANPDPQKPWVGRGYRVLLKDVAKNLRQADKTITSFMENPTPTIIVKFDADNAEFESEDGRERLKKRFLTNKTGEPWMIPGDLITVEQIKPLTLNDIAIKSTLEIDKKLVASIFGIPPFMLGVGSFNKDEYNSFVNTVLLPIAKSIEQELTRKLLTSENMFFRLNPRSLYAYDLTELIGAGKEMVDRTAMSRNEWRDWVGMIPDDRMEELIALENYIPVEMLGEQKKLVGNE